MSREIKFRAWHKEHKKMYRFDEIGYCDEYNHISFILNREDHREDGGTYMNLESGIEDFEVMQFTGLTDKNGKEIYEGDIFKSAISPINEVFWWKGGFYYQNSHAEGIQLGDEREKEVIGNIYENPELLLLNEA